MVWRRLKKTCVTLILFVLFVQTVLAQNTYDQKNIEVALRMIGHEVLLSVGDSTSLVLPIKKEKGQYRIEFASKFQVNPDSLVKTVKRVMRETKMSSAYIMQVAQCDSDDIVYSFEVKKKFGRDIVPCASRSLPKSCYALLFTLKGENETVAPSKNQTNGNSNSSIFWIAGCGLLLAVCTSVVIFRRRRKLPIELDADIITLGKFHFNKKKAELIIAEQRIELTGKEADLLLLLYNAANKTVERDDILRAVWNDDGDYVGRTLDVFISKLRKKLEADSSIQIVNVRSVGYKLVID
jgi:Transcriptional regulatory protein, C terminal